MLEPYIYRSIDYMINLDQVPLIPTQWRFSFSLSWKPYKNELKGKDSIQLCNFSPNVEESRLLSLSLYEDQTLSLSF